MLGRKWGSTTRGWGRWGGVKGGGFGRRASGVEPTQGPSEAEIPPQTQEGCGELFDSGQEFLDRVAISLGGKALVPAAAALLPAWLRDAGDWRKRHAALICLAQIAEGCAKVMGEQLGPLVGMCLQGLSDPHPRVGGVARGGLGFGLGWVWLGLGDCCFEGEGRCGGEPGLGKGRRVCGVWEKREWSDSGAAGRRGWGQPHHAGPRRRSPGPAAWFLPPMAPPPLHPKHTVPFCHGRRAAFTPRRAHFPLRTRSPRRAPCRPAALQAPRPALLPADIHGLGHPFKSNNLIHPQTNQPTN
jgi:hypothetical protein